MKLSSGLRLLASVLMIVALSCALFSQGRGGAAPAPAPRGGGAPAAQRGPTQPPRGPAPPRGAPAGRGAPRGNRGQEQPKEEILPDNGLVLAYVTVTGREKRAVPGLKRSNFQVFEDGVEQEIQAFSTEDGPVSVGFVVGGDPSDFRGIAPAFLKATPWDDEYFVLIDTGRPPGGTVIQNFTTDILKVPKNFPIGGVTPDSIYVGIDYLKEAANRRKLLLLFGGTLSTEDGPRGGLDPSYVIRMATKEAVQVYSIMTSADGTYDDSGVSDIAPLTGGRTYGAALSPGALEDVAEEIVRAISVQYFIGYRSKNEAKDGKWRSINVKLVDTPADVGTPKVWTRSGYYADKEKKSKK